MGNSGSRAPAPLGKRHVPDLEWKIHDFSALLETKATAAISGSFHCSGYKWYLQVSPMHRKNGDETPYVALSLALWPYMLEQGHTVHAVYEFSIYNHSNRMYCGCKESPFEKGMLDSSSGATKTSAFLVDDSCVFGAKILKIYVSSPEKEVALIQKKATTVKNFFVQKKGFVKGTYTWTMNNFLDLDVNNFVRSPIFEACEHKWYIGMYPRGDKCSTDCLTLALYLDASNELTLESRDVVQITLSIQDQKNGKHFTITSDLVVFASSWGWPNFIPLKKFKDPSGGYVVESKCIVKADLTIVGSSNDG